MEKRDWTEHRERKNRIKRSILNKILFILCMMGIIFTGVSERLTKAESMQWEDEQGLWNSETADEEPDTGEWNDSADYDGESLLEDNEKGYWQQGGFSDSYEQETGEQNIEQGENRAGIKPEEDRSSGNTQSTLQNSLPAEKKIVTVTGTPAPGTPGENTDIVTETPVPRIPEKAESVTAISPVPEKKEKAVTATRTPERMPAPSGETTGMPKRYPGQRIEVFSVRLPGENRAEIFLNGRIVEEIVSVRVNHREQLFEIRKNKLIIPLDHKKDNYIECAFLCSGEFTWTERKNNVILCYNIL